MSWEDTLRGWARPLSDTEDDRCAHAVDQIQKAIDSSSLLTSHDITVRVQGSYRNGTNVRQESDVDVYVRCDDVYLVDYSLSDGLTDEDVGLTTSSYTYAAFKSDVESALRAYFGSDKVARGNKAFDIHANSYRVDADVVACFEHRRYMRSGSDFYFESGTEFFADDGTKVINWPEQNYTNGTEKNKRTKMAFKKGVRILKHLRHFMEDSSQPEANAIPSYLLECLAWNVPDAGFDASTHYQMLQQMLAHLFNSTMNDLGCTDWGEVNELKYLFRGSQPWTRTKTHNFLSAAWDTVGFRD